MLTFLCFREPHSFSDGPDGWAGKLHRPLSLPPTPYPAVPDSLSPGEPPTASLPVRFTYCAPGHPAPSADSYHTSPGWRRL